ncbi:SusC/RagA family TonB-linked outer membrane protein [Terrimonas sp. NA20]|uniref:SusC/RagA family TonB-linked outer membrane protein n=1 Tax=Terrimonas ginsenosidimutans TaxID=2908004 RepID=A0ABS9KTC5_9BACT|nr:SusC/RagA family TonB-linked outer membrane protein [Terrimonas ginsenosidimutans]MCG2615540.1 SusC/RagA family TonB-linked outer membrane protein [Terrimonas ginsenosidimutans]
MKLFILYCIASLANACVYAQRISVSFKNASFREVIRQIEKQSSYTFVYTSEQLQRIPNTSIRKHKMDIRDLLGNLLQKSSIGYLIDGNYIILVSNHEQKRTVRGRILTYSGDPVEGATIYLQTENKNIITKADGSFELSGVTSGTALLITGAEIISTETEVGTADFLELKIQQKIKELDETIILGYGSTTRRFSTGNAVKVNTTEMNKLPRNDLFQFLQGKVPGMLITSSGEAPGASSLLQIRGQHSVNPNPLINYLIPPVDQPFIVLNGVPFAPQNNNANQLSSIGAPGSLDAYQNPYGGISPLSLIDPSDIESIEILKDAVATSLYGSRSSNGVILITTKQPSEEKLSIETIISSGISVRKAPPAMLSTDQYRELRKNAFTNDGIQADLAERSFSYAPDLLSFDSSRQINWGRYFFHAATPLWNAHSRISGSFRRIFFTGSIGFRNEDHLLKGDFFSKQLTISQQLRYRSQNQKINTTASVYYSNGKNVSTVSPALLRVISLPPNHPELYNSNGKLNWEYNGLPITDNPAAYLLQTYTMTMSAIQATTRTDYLIAKHLTISLNAGYSGLSTKESSLAPHASFGPQQQRNVRSLYGSGKFRTTVLEPQLEYKLSRKRVSLLIMTGATLQHHSVFLGSMRGSGYNDASKPLTLANATRIDDRHIFDNNTYQSLLARFSLQISGKYSIDLTGRCENSSHFSSDEKNGLFSSAGIGWIFSEETFVRKHLPFFNYGKIRISYGTTGNDNVGYSHFRDSWSRISTYTGNQPSADNVNEIPFGWSVTRKAEAALECYTFNNRLSFTFSAYFHRTGKQLISQLLPNQTSSSRYILNYPAIVHNRGIEITVTYRSEEHRRLRWSSQINITSHRNYLRSFEGLEKSMYARRYWTGQSLDSKQPLRFAGVDPGTGIYQFLEDNNYYVNTAPKLYGGSTQTVSIGRWKTEMQFDFRFQTGINHLRALYNHPPGSGINQPLLVGDYWRSPGDITTVQKPTVSPSSPAQLASFLIPGSDAIYSDASFLRLRNLSISYTINNKKQVNTSQSIQLYIQLQNIFTVTGFPLSDPETQSFYSYPRAATISAGIIIKN